MIDNEDSFVHTLADYFRQRGAEVRTYRSGVPLARIVEERPALVVHSPGPGRPGDFGVPALVGALAEAGIAQFGVCLGLQGIVEAFGGRIEVLDAPRHGKTWQVHHTGDRLFDGVPDPCEVGAYHSLIAVRDSVPHDLEVTSWTEEGLVMAVNHRVLPIAAVQFHPESILSFGGDVGHTIVKNAIRTLVEAAH
jgi:anthranilate synthase